LEFNPWLFSGKEDLAQAFLNQLQSVLSMGNESFKKLKEKLAVFGQNIGNLLDLSGLTKGAGKELGEILSKVLRSEPQNIAILKKEIREILLEEKTRIIVFIDDIDRLDKEEARQLFSVIKVLADFPYMFYILAFDREAIAEALDSGGCLSGDRFLEKIIQVPFEIPIVDRTILRNFLFKNLDALINGHSAVPFDSNHWTGVFLRGLDSFFRLPRDVIRFLNSISVTFPAICKEVNPVDFIAVEAIRVFKPDLYEFIRSKKDGFTRVQSGYSSSGQKEREEFLSSLEKRIQKEESEPMMNIITELFPNIGNAGYDESWRPEWRRLLRVCHPDIFPVYFHFSLPPDAISHLDVMDLIESALDDEQFAARLQQLNKEPFTVGTSKLTAMLDRMLDHGENGIPEDVIPNFFKVFLSIGDELLTSEEEGNRLAPGNDSRIVRLMYMLLKRYPLKTATPAIYQAINEGAAIHIQGRLLSVLGNETIRSQDRDAPVFPDEDIKKLQECWTESLPKKLSLDHEKLPSILFHWAQMGEKEKARSWSLKKTKTLKNLVRFITAFLGYTTSYSSLEGEKKTPRLNPKNLEPFIGIDEAARRLKRLDMKPYGKEEQTAVSQFLDEFDLLKQGRDPDSLDRL
jgi:predicted KAP-like P-loop ATPase